MAELLAQPVNQMQDQLASPLYQWHRDAADHQPDQMRNLRRVAGLAGGIAGGKEQSLVAGDQGRLNGIGDPAGPPRDELPLVVPQLAPAGEQLLAGRLAA